MKTFSILPQPTNTTCGPTCLHAVYEHFGHKIDLATVVNSVRMNTWGGTTAVNLGINALESGFDAEIYTCDLTLFDPTWFRSGRPVDLEQKLLAQLKFKTDPATAEVTEAYLKFLKLGGTLYMEDISLQLIRSYLDADRPIIAGLSCTWLYQSSRELPDTTEDDLRGQPAGHFVVLYDLDSRAREIAVADPYRGHKLSTTHCYRAPVSRLVGSIMLGVLTFDAKLLIVSPKESS